MFFLVRERLVINLIGKSADGVGNFPLRIEDTLNLAVKILVVLVRAAYFACNFRGIIVFDFRFGIAVFLRTGKLFFKFFVVFLPEAVFKSFLASLQYCLSVFCSSINFSPLILTRGKKPVNFLKFDKIKSFSRVKRKPTDCSVGFVLSFNASFSRRFGLLFAFDGRAFVELFFTEIADNSVTRTFSLKTAQRAVEIFVFTDSDCTHFFTLPLPHGGYLHNSRKNPNAITV